MFCLMSYLFCKFLENEITTFEVLIMLLFCKALSANFLLNPPKFMNSEIYDAIRPTNSKKCLYFRNANILILYP